jgi:hypothetical protein
MMFAMRSRLPTSTREDRPCVIDIDARDLSRDAVVPFHSDSALDAAHEADGADAPHRCSSAHASATGAHELDLEHDRAQFAERDRAHFHRRLRSIERETDYPSAHARMHERLATRDPHALERSRAG